MNDDGERVKLIASHLRAAQRLSIEAREDMMTYLIELALHEAGAADDHFHTGSPPSPPVVPVK